MEEVERVRERGEGGGGGVWGYICRRTIVAAQDELEDTIQPEKVEEIPRQRSDRSAGLFPSV